MSHIALDRKKEIERKVEQIRLDTGLSYPENNLLEIAESLGVKVVDADLPDFENKKVKGFIQWFEDENEKTKNAPYIAKIYLNSDQAEKVKNFTLAHEIGHFLLHKNSNDFRIDLQDYSLESDPENHETEANYFAGSLLMPREKFLNAIANSKNLEQVADAFAVSKPAVESRLRWLRVRVA